MIINKQPNRNMFQQFAPKRPCSLTPPTPSEKKLNQPKSIVKIDIVYTRGTYCAANYIGKRIKKILDLAEKDKKISQTVAGKNTTITGIQKLRNYEKKTSSMSSIWNKDNYAIDKTSETIKDIGITGLKAGALGAVGLATGLMTGGATLAALGFAAAVSTGFGIRQYFTDADEYFISKYVTLKSKCDIRLVPDTKMRADADLVFYLRANRDLVQDIIKNESTILKNNLTSPTKNLVWIFDFAESMEPNNWFFQRWANKINSVYEFFAGNGNLLTKSNGESGLYLNDPSKKMNISFSILSYLDSSQSIDAPQFCKNCRSENNKTILAMLDVMYKVTIEKQ